jgi:transcriptional regulator with XRE-family HTH domain
MVMDDREMGRRIGYWRRRRDLTQAVFADRIGRSKSWVEKVERGDRSAGRLTVLDTICEVLQIDLSALIGEDPRRTAPQCLDGSEVERIRSALERYSFGAGEPPSPSVSALRQQLDHVWSAFEFGDYQGSQAGNRDEALRRLLAAEQIAPPEVRCRPVAQATIADMLSRSRGTPAVPLARLAERAGVRP